MSDDFGTGSPFPKSFWSLLIISGFFIGKNKYLKDKH